MKTFLENVVEIIFYVLNTFIFFWKFFSKYFNNVFKKNHKNVKKIFSKLHNFFFRFRTMFWNFI